MRKTLILNASPRAKGDVAALLSAVKAGLRGPVEELRLFHARLSPCVDCRRCAKEPGCAVRDEMDAVYADDYDAVLVAAPVYFEDLPGPLLNVLSRLQAYYMARLALKSPISLRPKRGALILTGGGHGGPEGALKHAAQLLHALNAAGFEAHTILSLRTDELPAGEDEAALSAARALSDWLEGESLAQN